MSRMQKFFGSLLVTVSLSIAVVLGFANPAFARPYCDASSGPEPDCASVVCVTNPDPGDVIEVNEVFEVKGYVTSSRCPKEYPTPNYVELCFPYAGQPYCDQVFKSVDPFDFTWESNQVLSTAGNGYGEIVSTGFYGKRRVTRQNRMPIEVID